MTNHEAGTRKSGIAVATGAALCVACCALPFALPAVTIAGVGGVLAWIAGAYAWIAGLAAAAVAAGWLLIWRQSARSMARPAASTLYAMGAATAVLAAALIWPFVESWLC